jgi:hypothetical protein
LKLLFQEFNLSLDMKKSSITFSVDLIDLALKQLEFLEFIEESRVFYTESVSKNAAYRYEKYWLPLYKQLTENGTNPASLCPPDDIAWIWHCHLLSPTNYIKNCETLFGKVLVHFCFSRYEMQMNQLYTKILWEHHIKDQPFEPLTEPAQLDPDFKSRIEYDLVAASSRQKMFYYNVSLPHFRSREFLELCLKRYKKFLALKAKNPRLFIVPCYGIDLVWHTHQLNPSVYARETRELLGKVLPHDDSSSDRSPNSELTNSFNATKQAWLAEYKERFEFEGGMYRGEAPYFCSDFSTSQVDLSPFYLKNGQYKIEEAR